MTFEELKEKLADYGSNNQETSRQAKIIVVIKLLESLHLRTNLLLDGILSEDLDADKAFTKYISALAQAVNEVGDLVTRNK